jgi:hypothetical protein
MWATQDGQHFIIKHNASLREVLLPPFLIELGRSICV